MKMENMLKRFIIAALRLILKCANPGFISQLVASYDTTSRTERTGTSPLCSPMWVMNCEHCWPVWNLSGGPRLMALWAEVRFCQGFTRQETNRMMRMVTDLWAVRSDNEAWSVGHRVDQLYSLYYLYFKPVLIRSKVQSQEDAKRYELIREYQSWLVEMIRIKMAQSNRQYLEQCHQILTRWWENPVGMKTTDAWLIISVSRSDEELEFKKDLPHFWSFYQWIRRVAGPQGLGLGLAITKEIIKSTKGYLGQKWYGRDLPLPLSCQYIKMQWDWDTEGE